MHKESHREGWVVYRDLFNLHVMTCHFFKRKRNLMALLYRTLVALCTVLRVEELGVSGQAWSLRDGREAEGTGKTTTVKFLDKTEPFPLVLSPQILECQRNA